MDVVPENSRSRKQALGFTNALCATLCSTAGVTSLRFVRLSSQPGNGRPHQPVHILNGLNLCPDNNAHPPSPYRVPGRSAVYNTVVLAGLKF